MALRRPTPHVPTPQLVCDCFHQGQSYANWRPRGSEDWLLIHTDGGAGQFTSRLGSFTAREGEVVLYAPGDAQDYRTAPDAGHWDLMWVHFRPRSGWEPWLAWPRHESGLQYACLRGDENHAAFRAALERMQQFARRSIPGALDFASNALEEALLWAKNVTSRGEEVARDERIGRAADHLSANLREPFELETLAARYGLSVSRFAHLFKEQMGIAPQQFLERRRMKHACHLLRLTGLSVAEVAREVGYSDPFYFSNRFRRHLGHSPLQFRREREPE